MSPLIQPPDTQEQANREFNTPNAARIHNAFLGGVQNYAVDRKSANEWLAVAPAAMEAARRGRVILSQEINRLALGTAQFLDLGCGLPSPRGLDVHEVAQAVQPSNRVAYVDNDRMASAFARTTLHDNDHVLPVFQNLLDVPGLIEDTRDFLNWSEPVAVLLWEVLHCLPDDPGGPGPRAYVEELVARLPAGSVLVVGHPVSNCGTVRTRVTELLRGVEGFRGRIRDADDLTALLDLPRLKLEESGLRNAAPFATNSSWWLWSGTVRVTD